MADIEVIIETGATIEAEIETGATVQATIENGFIASLPTPPSENGTYSFQCTVSSGVATYAWV